MKSNVMSTPFYVWWGVHPLHPPVSATGKAPGPDSIHPEFIKNLGPSGLKWLAAFYYTCMRLNLLPKI